MMMMTTINNNNNNNNNNEKEKKKRKKKKKKTALVIDVAIPLTHNLPKMRHRKSNRSNRGGSDIFRTRPDRPWGLPCLLYNGYRVIPGGKAAGAWC
jgi:hypothetical protein